MKRSILLLLIFLISNSCREKTIDPSKKVRPVGMQISVSGGEYRLTWQPGGIVCITEPCPDIANTEAEKYEIQIATEEFGPFKTYRTVDTDQRSINIPVTSIGMQIIARIASKAKGAPTAYSAAVMATAGFLSQSAFFPGLDLPGRVLGGDITADGSRATYALLHEDGAGGYTSTAHVAELQNERIISSKVLNDEGSTGRFSPDGQQVAYVSGLDKGIVIYDIASGSRRTIPVPDLGFMWLDWSPDGKWLAFSVITDTASRLWKIPVSGGTATPLTPVLSRSEWNQLILSGIDWSPNGQFLALARMRNDNTGTQWRSTISLYSPEGAGELRYFEAQPGWTDIQPAISPDGKQLAFLSSRTEPVGNVYSLWVRDLTTGTARRIELLPDLIPNDSYGPRWLGNERLLFQGSQRGKQGFFTVFL